MPTVPMSVATPQGLGGFLADRPRNRRRSLALEPGAAAGPGPADRGLLAHTRPGKAIRAGETHRAGEAAPGPARVREPTGAEAVADPAGPGRFLVDAATDPRSILVLGHGAGGGTGAADLELLARQLPERGTTVVRFEQPWRTAGRRVAGPPASLDEAWVAAVGWLREQTWGQGRLFAGGRSAGARVACRTALVLG